LTSNRPDRFAGIRDHVIVRLMAYYGVSVGLFAGINALFPGLYQYIVAERARQFGGTAMEPVGVAPPVDLMTPDVIVPVVFGMIAALLLALPVAWVYLWTRPPEKYRQGFAQTLIVLPLAIALVVFLVKGSLALAFSLAGIVAAIRWRTSLNETMDAVFMFVIIGIGLAAGVQLLAVAFVASLIFNVVALAVWRTDFAGESMVAVGWRLQPAPADTTWPTGDSPSAGAPKRDVVVRISTTDADAARLSIQSAFGTHTKRWDETRVAEDAGETPRLEFVARLRKRSSAATLRRAIEESGAPYVDSVKVDTVGGRTKVQ
jgi:ABC-type antimicrobial peptide transport system permease subunit